MSERIEKMFTKGEVIIKEGHAGSSFYVILSGMVEVVKRKGDKEVLLTVLGPSEFFGEMSLIGPGSGKRSATVRTLEDTRVAIMSQKAFEEYLGNMSPGIRNLLSRLSSRLKKTSEKVEQQEELRQPEDQEEPTFDYTLTLDELEKARAHAVDVHFLNRKFRKGQVILRQGETGQCGFIIKKGKLEVSRRVEGRKIVLSTLEEHDILGENAMFDNNPRSATVMALTDGELMVFGKRDMLSMARQSPLELFMIMDSMTEKIDRTSEVYCETLIRLDNLDREVAALREENELLRDNLEMLVQQKAQLEERLGLASADPAAERQENEPTV